MLGTSWARFLNFDTCVNGGQWYSTIIGTVLYQLQSNKMIQIRSIVQKVTFGTFSAILGTFWHSRAQFLNFATCVNGGQCCYSIIGIVLDHFQPNQMIQIRSIVEKRWFLIFLASTFLALLGPISEFCHMSEWWPTLPYHNRKRFRPFPAKSNDSNWIRSPKSMFFAIFSIFCQKGKQKNFRNIFFLENF